VPEAKKTLPSRPGRRTKVVATALVVAIGIAYVVFAGLYLGTRVTPAPDAVLQAATPPGGVSVVFVPQRVDPERENVQGALRISVDRTVITSDVTVRVFPFLDTSQIVIPAADTTYEQDANLSVEGEVRGYPFDSYTGTVEISAADTTLGNALPVAGGVLPIDGLTGWNIYVSEDIRVAPNVLADSVTVERALTTQVTVAILATLVLALGVVAIALAWSVAVGRKEPSFGEATWLAATIFSVISVRNFMPGAPPIGAYLDALFIVPTILALFLSMTLLVVFWLARRTPDDPAEQGS
jgi:Domain of unknown function (DUF4436)